MKQTLLLNVLGNDQPGLVEKLSDCVLKHQGNWLQSSLSHLGGQFAGLIEVQLEEEQVVAFESALKNLNSDAFNVSIVKPLDSQTLKGEALELSLLGNDKPGIVHEISLFLSEHGVNVEKLASEIQPAPMSGGTLFSAKLRVSLPEGMTAEDLRTQLESMADDLMVDFSFTH